MIARDIEIEGVIDARTRMESGVHVRERAVEWHGVHLVGCEAQGTEILGEGFIAHIQETGVEHYPGGVDIPVADSVLADVHG